MLVISMPLWLTHETLFKSSIFKVLDKIAISTPRSSTPSASRTTRSSVRNIPGRWRVIGRTRLLPDWGVRIQMPSNPLEDGRYSTLLLINGGRTLPTSSCGCLGIEVLLLAIRGWHRSLVGVQQAQLPTVIG